MLSRVAGVVFGPFKRLGSLRRVNVFCRLAARRLKVVSREYLTNRVLLTKFLAATADLGAGTLTFVFGNDFGRLDLEKGTALRT